MMCAQAKTEAHYMVFGGKKPANLMRTQRVYTGCYGGPGIEVARGLSKKAAQRLVEKLTADGETAAFAYSESFCRLNGWA